MKESDIFVISGILKILVKSVTIGFLVISSILVCSFYSHESVTRDLINLIPVFVCFVNVLLADSQMRDLYRLAESLHDVEQK